MTKHRINDSLTSSKIYSIVSDLIEIYDSIDMSDPNDREEDVWLEEFVKAVRNIKAMLEECPHKGSAAGGVENYEN